MSPQPRGTVRCGTYPPWHGGFHIPFPMLLQFQSPCLVFCAPPHWRPNGTVPGAGKKPSLRLQGLMLSCTEHPAQSKLLASPAGGSRDLTLAGQMATHGLCSESSWPAQGSARQQALPLTACSAQPLAADEGPGWDLYNKFPVPQQASG